MIVRPFLISVGLLAGAALFASCREASPVGVDARTTVALAGRHGPGPADGDSTDVGDGDDGNEESDSLVSCRPLPYDSVTQTIGPEGGMIAVRHNNWLVVPAGALREAVQITAVAPSDTVAMVRFQPAGLRFQTTATLVMSYDNCRVPNSLTPRLALVTDAFRVLEFLTPADAPPTDSRFKKPHPGRQVIGELHHFSNYAVAW